MLCVMEAVAVVVILLVAISFGPVAVVCPPWLGMPLFMLFLLGVIFWFVNYPSRKAIRRLKTMPLEQLMDETFLRCEPSHYFRRLDETHPDVARFRELINRKDAEALSREWLNLCKSFVRIEAAGRARDKMPTCGSNLESIDFYNIFRLRWKIIAEHQAKLKPRE